MATEAEVRQLKKRHSAQLLAKPGIVGVATVRDDKEGFILQVMTDGSPAAQREAPSQIEGYPVRIVESGTITKIDE